MGCEIFGWEGAPLFAIAVAVSFPFGRDVGMYGRGATSAVYRLGRMAALRARDPERAAVVGAAVDAADGEDRKISLSRNFRSRQEILDAANFVFANILSTEMGEMEYDADAALYFGADYYPARSDCETEFHLVAARMKSVNNPSPVKKLTAEARFAALRIRQLLEIGRAHV